MAAPLKTYIERILNVLAEIDDQQDDKKQIYKELAGDGYDRTVVSQVVGHLRKKAAKPGKFAEQSALFDLYLADFEAVGTVVATHAACESADEDGVVEHISPPAQTAPSVLTGGAADPGEGIALSPDPSKMVPNKLKMNPEFFGEPHPACQRPGFCGGNSRLAPCIECRAAAGIDGHAHDADERVLN